jgi:hypothetical protein
VNPRTRAGDTIDSLETAATDDAALALAGRFSALFTIRLAHNPVGAFAFRGRTDERSDRWVGVAELVDRGYEDAYRQFLEPVIGASGEQIHGAIVIAPAAETEDLPLRPEN